MDAIVFFILFCFTLQLEFERQSLLIVNSSAVSSDPTSQNRINGLSNNHGSVTAMASSSLAASLSFHEQFCKPSLLPKKVVVISISEVFMFVSLSF